MGKATTPADNAPKSRGREVRQRTLRARGRSLADFVPLLESEHELLRATAAGEIALIGNSLPERGDDRKRVRAALLRFLAMGGDELAPVHEKGVQVQGGWVADLFDLESCDAAVPLRFLNCRFDQALVMIETGVRSLSLDGSDIAGLKGDRLKAIGSISLAESFRSSGSVRFVSASIGGDLDCRGALLKVSGDFCLVANFARISGRVLLSDGFCAFGGVDFAQARFSEFVASGGGFHAGHSGALLLDSIEAQGGVFLNDGFTATGEVRLLEAKIGRSLICTDGRFINSGGFALSCDRMTVGESVYLRSSFSAEGMVRFHLARIDGDLSCIGGRFRSLEGRCLSGDGADIGGSVLVATGFSAEGSVAFNGARIGRNMTCTGGTFHHPGRGFALICDATEIGGTLSFKKVDVKAGGVSLGGTTAEVLSDDLESWPAPLMLDGFRYERVIAAPMSAQARIAWLEKQGAVERVTGFRPQPWIHLVRQLRRAGQGSEANKVAIRMQRALRFYGLVGQRPTVGVPITARWANRLLNESERMAHRLYGAIAGYGYRKFQATLIAVMAVWALSAGAYGLGADYFGPTNPLVFQQRSKWSCGYLGEAGKLPWTRCASVPPEYTAFNPWMYSADLILPFLELQQDRDWAPIVARTDGSPIERGLLLRRLMWLEILFGWGAVGYLITLFGSAVNKSSIDRDE